MHNKIFIRRTILLIVASVAGNSNSWGKKLKDTSHPECVILPKASLNSVREKDRVKIKNMLLLRTTFKKYIPIGQTRYEY